MKTVKRISAFDFLRGLALILVVFFHTSVYNFANIHKVDFSNPPLVVVLISFLILWGGLLIIYSAVINSILYFQRFKELKVQHLRFLIITGLIYLGVHFLLNIFLGRWSNDFEYNRPNMTVVAATLRNMSWTFPKVEKIFEGSSISTIGLNLMIVSVILWKMLKGQGLAKMKRNYWILGAAGTFVMLVSFIRIPLASFLEESISHHQYWLSLILSFTIANPYPLLPYLAYGLLGSMVGLMIAREEFGLLKKVGIPLGLAFLVYGLIGAMNFDKSISQADFFWYFKTHLELGVFILTLVIFGLMRNVKLFDRMGVVLWFSRVSLTVYLFETLLSEVLRIALNEFIPGWNETITGCLWFGLLNVFVWVLILWAWRKADFKYSWEYFWVRLFSRLGKSSTKLNTVI